jgi:hypothetical protein
VRRVSSPITSASASVDQAQVGAARNRVRGLGFELVTRLMQVDLRGLVDNEDDIPGGFA